MQTWNENVQRLCLNLGEERERLPMKRFAVIGKPIDHSLSPFIHQSFAKQLGIDLTYEKILGDEQCFEQQVSEFFSQKGSGLNVTLPFKQRAFAMAQTHTLRCRKAGAANTLWMKDGVLWADNTDGIGLIRSLKHFIDLRDKRILIVGAGGAARGILQPLINSKPLKLVLANRSMEKLEPLVRDFPFLMGVGLNQLSGEFDLIINATSSSVSGENLQIPIECFKNKPLCYDLSYNKTAPTAFVSFAKNLGAPAVDGLSMLVLQASEAFYIWNGARPDACQVLLSFEMMTPYINNSPLRKKRKDLL